jgi:hypothetical protein
MKKTFYAVLVVLFVVGLTALFTQAFVAQDKGVKIAAGTVELFGHVTLVQGYDLPAFKGCHALITLRDSPGKTVAVLTKSLSLQSLLDTGLSTGNLVAFYGKKLAAPPTPRGGTWSVEVYDIDGVILYNMK